MELRLDMTARTDRPTVVNLTNHSFFNLDGACSGRNILDHHLTVAADHFLAIDAGAIPLPQPPSAVDGTPFDFREGFEVGARIRNDHPQLRVGPWLRSQFLSRPGKRRASLRRAARRASVAAACSELFTNQPGLQVYSGNFLDGSTAGKGGRLYRQSDAICLEPHAWPNTPEPARLPDRTARPGRSLSPHHDLSLHACQPGHNRTQSEVELPGGSGQ